MFALGTSAVFEDVPPTVKLPAAVSTSPTPKGNAPVASSSSMLRLTISEIVGGSFTGVTVSTNVSLAVSAPSLTVTVMVAVPL